MASSEKKLDKVRPEGAYVSWSTYPPEGGPYSTVLFLIERVNGDSSVSSVEVTPDEARVVIARLNEELAAK